MIDLSALSVRRTKPMLKEFLPAMEQAGLMSRSQFKGQYSAYDVYTITQKGRQTLRLLQTQGGEVLLSVPPAVRAAEIAAAKAAKERRAEVAACVEQLAKRLDFPVASVRVNANGLSLPCTPSRCCPLLHSQRHLALWMRSDGELKQALYGSRRYRRTNSRLRRRARLSVPPCCTGRESSLVIAIAATRCRPHWSEVTSGLLLMLLQDC